MYYCRHNGALRMQLDRPNAPGKGAARPCYCQYPKPNSLLSFCSFECARKSPQTVPGALLDYLPIVRGHSQGLSRLCNRAGAAVPKRSRLICMPIVPSEVQRSQGKPHNTWSVLAEAKTLLLPVSNTTLQQFRHHTASSPRHTEQQQLLRLTG